MRLSRARLSADPAPLSSFPGLVLPDMGRLWTWNFGALAEDALADSKGFMLAFWAVDWLMRDLLFFGSGRPFGRDDCRLWYFLFPICFQRSLIYRCIGCF